MRRRAAMFLSLIFLFAAVFSEETPKAAPYGTDEFPPWLKDLRRAEIISFGTLPFATFFGSIAYDTYRYYTHGQASGYLPWPFKDSETAVAQTEDEQKMILLASAGVSVGVAVIDFSVRTIIRLIRDSQAEKHNESIPDPIRIEPEPVAPPAGAADAVSAPAAGTH
jgi:hypothetical protein